MSWNYRLVQYPDSEGFGVHEVYYDEAGQEENMTQRPCGFVGASASEIVTQLERAIKDIWSHPIFVPPTEWLKDGH